MKKHKNKIIAGVVVAIVMVFLFWYGGDSPNLHGWSVNPAKSDTPTANNDSSKKDTDTLTADEKIAMAENILQSMEAKSDCSAQTPPDKSTEDNQKSSSEEASDQKEQKVKDNSSAKTQKQPGKDDSSAKTQKQTGNDDSSAKTQKQTGKDDSSAKTQKQTSKDDSSDNKAKEETIPQSNNEPSKEPQNTTVEPETTDKYMTEPVPEGKPLPIEPQNVTISDKELTCILSVRCDTILENINALDKDKVDIVPKDGVIYAEQTVTFFEGESVFNVLLREMKRNKIHMEFENVPIYNSAYIEGIANLYEFDCGELSGWTYKVNGWFPNYGCSRYQLKAGDKIEWLYTCNLGIDVGGYYSAAQYPASQSDTKRI